MLDNPGGTFCKGLGYRYDDGNFPCKENEQDQDQLGDGRVDAILRGELTQKAPPNYTKRSFRDNASRPINFWQ